MLESALTDVLSIVGVFALLQIHTQGDVEPGRLVGTVLASLIFAAAIGVLGCIGWLLQELRVSLFAQELKTPVIVSVKRLEKMLAGIRG